MEYDDTRKETELEKLKVEIRKMEHDMTMDAWKVAIAAVGVLAALGTAVKALGWLLAGWILLPTPTVVSSTYQAEGTSHETA